MLREFSLIFQLLGCIIFIALFGDYLPTPVEKTFFTISLVIKELLVFALPFIVYTFVASCLLSFGQRGPLLIFSIFALLTISNFLGVILGYEIGTLFLNDFGHTNALFNDQTQGTLKPWFEFHLPKLLSTDYALVAGILTGVVGTFFGSRQLTPLFVKLKGAIHFGFSKVFIPLLPIYITGFLIDMENQGSLTTLFTDYGSVLLLVVASLILSIVVLFMVAAQGNPTRFMEYMKNALPSGLVGFSTMSSAATMPVTMRAADLNTKNSGFAHVFIPLASNIHQVGDFIIIPISMVALQFIFGTPPLPWDTLLMFSLIYSLTKFGNAGVPGGSVIVLLPVFQQYLGYDAQMNGLMTMLYVLMDPFGTATNVMGNGAYTVIFNNFYVKWFHRNPQEVATI